MTRTEQVIGHTFGDPALLREALTHPSFTHKHPGEPHYERLEHLGDAILGFLVADHLYRTNRDADEARLHRRRVAVVEGRTLARRWAELGLDPEIRLGNSMTANDSARENVFEAVMAAVYLDAGIDAVRAVVLRLLAAELAAPLADTVASPKTALQNLVQAEGSGPPRYVEDGRTGADHEPVFTVSVWSEGAVLGTGVGRTRKKAEDAAAQDALLRRIGT